MCLGLFWAWLRCCTALELGWTFRQSQRIWQPLKTFPVQRAAEYYALLPKQRTLVRVRFEVCDFFQISCRRCGLFSRFDASQSFCILPFLAPYSYEEQRGKIIRWEEDIPTYCKSNFVLSSGNPLCYSPNYVEKRDFLMTHRLNINGTTRAIFETRMAAPRIYFMFVLPFH